MAAPTAPTIDDIVNEAFDKSPKKVQSTADTNRAKNQWMEEIKNDIWIASKKLKDLQVTSVNTTTNGRSEYTYPPDYSSDLTMQIIWGQHIGTCQAGSTTTTIKLAADEDITNTEAQGKEIVTTAGTGNDQLSRIYSYNSSTQVASIYPAWSTTPDNTTQYMIIDSSHRVRQKPVFDEEVVTWQGRSSVVDRGLPDYFFPLGNSSDGIFLLDPIPYRQDSILYVIKLRYYMNLMALDLTGARMGNLYQRWRNLWLQGLKWKIFEDLHDSRADKEEAKYYQLISQLTGRETYGHDLHDMSITVET